MWYAPQHIPLTPNNFALGPLFPVHQVIAYSCHVSYFVPSFELC
jgi:hypothetical protein